ncbi:MAG: hypothetical protein HC924_17845 [Synechococcaceae cyanobacterium SM2_3_2]|nr:hypothetical protein [Synechococcaceae cyanobacterium SM2_3_2]
MTSNLIKSLATLLRADPSNLALIRNYLVRLGVELDSRLAPPECRVAEAQYLAATLLVNKGILSAEVLARYRDPWEKWQIEMADRRSAAVQLTADFLAEDARVKALPLPEQIAHYQNELERLQQPRLTSRGE